VSHVLPLFIVLSAVLIVTVLYDYRHLIIPDEFVIVLSVIAGVYLSFLLYLGAGVQVLVLHALASLAAASFYFVLWLMSKGRWIGFGDAKLALVLGLFLYPLEAFSMVVFSFWIGAGVSVLLMAFISLLKRGQKHLPFLPVTLTMKSEVPFAPFLIASFLIVFFGQVEVLTLLESLI
jgi:prepilin signal peptidase PulO-like enzyme (type II secretory pathway)